jgi:glycosyltransferase involved in cell wall biosynthesis
MLGYRVLDSLSALALVPYALGTTPSQRYRLEQWAPLLTESGVQLDFEPFADAELTALLQNPGRVLRKGILVLAALRRRERLVTAPVSCNLVVVHRAASMVGPPLVERRLIARGLPMVYDFDDAIFRLHAAAANRSLAWLKAPGKTAELCRTANHVTVCSTFLADYARAHNPRVSIVRSSVDTDVCRPMPRSENERLVVGWMGSSTSQTYLEAAVPMLRELLASRPVELRVVSSRQPLLSGLRHTWRPWSAATEVTELSAFDVGIMPMPDDDWARGKCAFKALQYMAAGVSTVAEAVGANLEVIQHGRNGFLASSMIEWLECVQALVDNRELRLRLGDAGRRTVEERYSMRKSAAAFEMVVREAAERAAPRR